MYVHIYDELKAKPAPDMGSGAALALFLVICNI
jgi:hypothetical protein